MRKYSHTILLFILVLTFSPLFSQINQHPLPPKQPSIQERLEMIDNKICNQLEITFEQKTAIKNAFRVFFTDMDQMMRNVNGASPDKAKIEKLENSRDEKIKNILSPALYFRYIKFEKTTRPKRNKPKGPAPSK